MSNALKYPPEGGDYNRGIPFIAISSVLGLLGTSTTIIRIYMRTVERKLGLDDLCIVLANIIYLLELSFAGLSVRAGYGRHLFYLTKPQVVEATKWTFVTQVLIFFVNPFWRTSICLFVLRIKQTRWLRWSMYTLIGCLFIFCIIPLVAFLAQCHPINAYWDRTQGTCSLPTTYNNTLYAYKAYSILVDFICSLLPIVILWKIQISTRLKVGVCALMSLGLMGTACAIFITPKFNLDGDVSDITWSLPLISIFASLEENLGILGANLALSRFAYLFFRDPKRTRGRSGRPMVYPSYMPTKDSKLGSTFSKRNNRNPPEHGSMVPLSSVGSSDGFERQGGGINKTTDFYVTQHPRGTGDNRVSRELRDIDAYVVEDRV